MSLSSEHSEASIKDEVLDRDRHRDAAGRQCDSTGFKLKCVSVGHLWSGFMFVLAGLGLGCAVADFGWGVGVVEVSG